MLSFSSNSLQMKFLRKIKSNILKTLSQRNDLVTENDDKADVDDITASTYIEGKEGQWRLLRMPFLPKNC